MSQNIKNLFLVCLIIFLDFLGYGIILPVLAVHFFTLEIKIFSNFENSDNIKNLLFAIIIAAYPIFQMIGSPLIGYYADKYGRKTTLIITLIGSIIGYATFLLGFSFKNIMILIFGRIISGFMGGNAALANTIVADISNKNNRTKYYGFVSLSMALGIILGPLLGGVLYGIEKNKILFLSNNLLPFLIPVILSMIALILAIFILDETKLSKNSNDHKINSEILYFLNLLFTSNLKELLLTSFFLFLGFNSFVYTVNLYFSKILNLSPYNIGLFLSISGLFLTISISLINPIISKKLSNENALWISLISLTFVIFTFAFTTKLNQMYFLIPFLTFFYGISQANIASLLAIKGDYDDKGKLFGLNQSMQSLAETLSPILISTIFSINPVLSFTSASFFTLISWLFLIKFKVKNN